jgi:hypothetical protein
MGQLKMTDVHYLVGQVKLINSSKMGQVNILCTRVAS